MTTTIRGTDNSAAAPALTGNDSDTGIYFPAANKLGLVTGGTERVIVDDSGNVGIGTSSPGYTTAGRTVLQVNGSTSSLIGLAYGGTNAGYLFAQATDTTLWSEGSRNLVIGTASAGSIGFYTNNTERIRVTDNGLTFNGDTAAANALDDYEEGTWTPAFLIGTWTYNTAYTKGTYTKIGNRVFCTYSIIGSSSSGTTGDIQKITGLPYASSSAITWGGAGNAGYVAQLGVNVASLTHYMDGNETSFYLTYLTGSSGSTAAVLGTTTGTPHIIGTFAYFTS